ALSHSYTHRHTEQRSSGAHSAVLERTRLSLPVCDKPGADPWASHTRTHKDVCCETHQFMHRALSTHTPLHTNAAPHTRRSTHAHTAPHSCTPFHTRLVNACA
uniref:Uncharacterized protein n=1 Tax=Neogobius melanostomus TaxID=47308 RepID=A0A8C6S8M5_9GOBI